MSINIQQAIASIRDMASIIDPEEDYITIAAAEEHMRMSAEQRKQELDEAWNSLKARTRVLDAARISSTRPPSVLSAEQHAATLNELDVTRLSLCKAINEAEDSISNKLVELAQLKEEARMLEQSDPAAEHDLDGTAIRLQIYKGLGFQPILDVDGGLEKMLVESSSHEVHIVPFDGRMSDFDHAQLLWKLASS